MYSQLFMYYQNMLQSLWCYTSQNKNLKIGTLVNLCHSLSYCVREVVTAVFATDWEQPLYCNHLAAVNR